MILFPNYAYPICSMHVFKLLPFSEPSNGSLGLLERRQLFPAAYQAPHHLYRPTLNHSSMYYSLYSNPHSVSHFEAIVLAL